MTVALLLSVFYPDCSNERLDVSQSMDDHNLKFTDWKVHGSNRPVSRLPLSRLGKPGSVSALMLPSGGMTAWHRVLQSHQLENILNALPSTILRVTSRRIISLSSSMNRVKTSKAIMLSSTVSKGFCATLDPGAPDVDGEGEWRGRENAREGSRMDISVKDSGVGSSVRRLIKACGRSERGISLTPVVTRLLASIVLRRLTVARETLTREPLAIQGKRLEVVERFMYLGSCINSDCSVTDEVNARICKARAAFANLRHLWRQNRLSLNLKGRVYQTTVRAVLLYSCETWPIRAAELRRLQVFDNRCLRTTVRVNWCRCVTGTSIEECVQHQKLRWLVTDVGVTDAEPSFAEEIAVFHAQFRVA
ncbi:hypothetical protein T265_08392 [Opisthorchis viverrini]|uniref:DUF6451 domain-containing protein n=1 Tax=Opisthorchis viverrini TaxID=6198 RepID=A0A074Z9L1_OPIVI|nr:hypothetical protein T265_08392 [Opisthorchis viverrini]KER23803.1 hypothetical protein T265_08392 [Opisthorchis viverrini]